MERHMVFQVLPEALDWIELRAVGREEDQPDVLGNRQFLGFMEPPVVQDQNTETFREPG